MKPIFKYSGGKSRELKLIKKLLPNNFDEKINRVVEPFAGSAAVAFGLEKPAIISDLRENNIKTFEAVRDNFNEIYDYIENIKKEANNHTEEKYTEFLNGEYYRQRDEMFGTTDPIDIAKRWILLRQLCFSGMDRINNKTGKFNVPFGWYKKLTCNLSKEHSDLLKTWDLILGNWTDAYDKADKNDFTFLDPPYYNRNSEYGGDYVDNEQLHIDIAKKFFSNPSKAMMVHIDCELYRDLYKDAIIYEKPFTYSQNFKSRDNSKSKVNHLYIMNYKPDFIKKIEEAKERALF